MLSTNLILRIYLMLFVVIWGLDSFRCRIDAMPSQAMPCKNIHEIGERHKMNAEDDARIEQAIKLKLMMLNTRENHTTPMTTTTTTATTFDLMQVHSMTVRLTVGLMYESIVDVKINENLCRCAIKFWVMPWLNANKFQMKCEHDDDDDDNSSGGNNAGNNGKQREYHLIEGALHQMNASEVSAFGDRLANALQRHGMPTVRRIIWAEHVVVNGFIDLASVELQRNADTNETIECAVEAWESSSIFHDLYIACESNVYTVLSSLYASQKNQSCIKTSTWNSAMPPMMRPPSPPTKQRNSLK